MPRIKPAHLVLVLIAIIFAVFALPQILADQPGARSTSGSLITETINVTETDSSATFTVKLQESGAGAEHEADHIFESLAGIPGVGNATFDTESLQLTVAYDSATIAEEPIRQRLLAAGYVTPTVADATPMELAPDGSVQRIAVADDGGFQPWLIRAQAGVPIEIDFAPGTECRVGVKFPELGVEQDISQGGTVQLPALEAGNYTIACSQDGNEGTLIVE